MIPQTDMRRSLSDRVAKLVAGRGIPRRSIDAAVARVLTALEKAPALPVVPGAPGIVATFTASASPDLASRVRAALEKDGVVVQELGAASVGRHTVVTARIPGEARAVAARLSERLSLSLTIVDAPSGAGT